MSATILWRGWQHRTQLSTGIVFRFGGNPSRPSARLGASCSANPEMIYAGSSDWIAVHADVTNPASTLTSFLIPAISASRARRDCSLWQRGQTPKAASQNTTRDAGRNDWYHAVTVNFFTNKFRKLGFIKYNGGLQIKTSLLSVVLQDETPTAWREVYFVFRQ